MNCALLWYCKTMLTLKYVIFIVKISPAECNYSFQRLYMYRSTDKLQNCDNNLWFFVICLLSICILLIVTLLLTHTPLPYLLFLCSPVIIFVIIIQRNIISTFKCRTLMPFFDPDTNMLFLAGKVYIITSVIVN